jgi:hypothetical protein
MGIVAGGSIHSGDDLKGKIIEVPANTPAKMRHELERIATDLEFDARDRKASADRERSLLFRAKDVDGRAKPGQDTDRPRLDGRYYRR